MTLEVLYDKVVFLSHSCLWPWRCYMTKFYFFLTAAYDLGGVIWQSFISFSQLPMTLEVLYDKVLFLSHSCLWPWRCYMTKLYFFLTAAYDLGGVIWQSFISFSQLPMTKFYFFLTAAYDLGGVIWQSCISFSQLPMTLEVLYDKVVFLSHSCLWPWRCYMTKFYFFLTAAYDLGGVIWQSFISFSQLPMTLEVLYDKVLFLSHSCLWQSFISFSQLPMTLEVLYDKVVFLSHSCLWPWRCYMTKLYFFLTAAYDLGGVIWQSFISFSQLPMTLEVLYDKVLFLSHSCLWPWRCYMTKFYFFLTAAYDLGGVIWQSFISFSQLPMTLEVLYDKVLFLSHSCLWQSFISFSQLPMTLEVLYVTAEKMQIL